MKRMMTSILGSPATKSMEGDGESRSRRDRVPRRSSIIEDTSTVNDGCFVIDGLFAGSLVTRGHLLEIALPIEAQLPGWPLLELVHMLGSSATAAAKAASTSRGDAIPEEEEEDLGPQKPKVSPEVWESLAHLLRAELPAKQAAIAGSWRLASTVADPEALAVSQRESQRLAEQVAAMSTELGGLREECNRVQLDAAQLRARNSSLAGFLATAETSAVKLRQALTQAAVAGASPRAGVSSSTSRPRSGSPLFAAREAAAAPSSRTLRLPTPRGSTPRSSSGARGTAGAGEASPHRGEMERLVPPSDKALVADLKELEKWASELRTMGT